MEHSDKNPIITIRLLIASLLIYFVASIFLFFEVQSLTVFAALLIGCTIAIVLNVFGIKTGMDEYSTNPKIVLIGIIGNFVPIVFWLVLLIYSIITVDIGPSS